MILDGCASEKNATQWMDTVKPIHSDSMVLEEAVSFFDMPDNSNQIVLNYSAHDPIANILNNIYHCINSNINTKCRLLQSQYIDSPFWMSLLPVLFIQSLFCICMYVCALFVHFFFERKEWIDIRAIDEWPSMFQIQWIIIE